MGTHRSLRDKIADDRGFSTIELIFAVSLFSMLSLACLTALRSQMRLSSTLLRSQEARLHLEEAVDSFLASSDAGEGTEEKVIETDLGLYTLSRTESKSDQDGVLESMSSGASTSTPANGSATFLGTKFELSVRWEQMGRDHEIETAVWKR